VDILNQKTKLNTKYLNCRSIRVSGFGRDNIIIRVQIQILWSIEH
jgi:hypothetical protein